ncbi:MAG TPA: hypothetical protein VGM51_14485 [Armatimonadota bacterium]|jgi:hypothetical protein
MIVTRKRVLTVFVNDFRVDVRERSTVRDAIRIYDRAFLKAIEFSKAEVMDADGYPVPLDAPAIEWEHVYVCLLPWVSVPHRHTMRV